MQKQQAQLTEQQQKIAANKAAIDAAVARFGQLDDYYILDETTVYFGNGQVKVDPKYIPQLLALTEKAKTINGYMIEVKGFASSVGSVALNLQLSEDRANSVTKSSFSRATFSPQASEKIRKDNDERLFDQARRRVRAWEAAKRKNTVHSNCSSLAALQFWLVEQRG